MWDEEPYDVEFDRPDPHGPPVPVPRRRPSFPEMVTWTGATVAGIGCVLVLLASQARPTLGATRSSRLQWEQRRLQIERALKEQNEASQRQADEPPAVE